jgi:hypothetical protein
VILSLITFSSFFDRVGGAGESGAGDRIAPERRMMGAALIVSVGWVTVGVGEAKSFVPIVGSFSSGFPVGDSSLSAASFSSSSSQILIPASHALVAPSQSFEADSRRAKRTGSDGGNCRFDLAGFGEAVCEVVLRL